MSEKKLSTFQVLRNKFPENEYVLIKEVSDASGFSRSRSLDYMLINLWNSRGLAITGIEEKSWRNDWLKELKNPQKQENHFKHCDYFYLLTTEENVAKLEEIPITWGWYHINKSGVLKTMKTAPKLEAQPIGKSLMCAMLRRAASKDGYVLTSSTDELIELKVKNKLSEFEHGDKAFQSLQKLKAIVELFEKESGIEIVRGWYNYYSGVNAGTVGRIVKQILENGVDAYIKKAEGIKLKAENMLADIVKHIKEIKEGS